MDSKTFRVLDQSVQGIKDDRQNNTPAEVQALQEALGL